MSSCKSDNGAISHLFIQFFDQRQNKSALHRSSNLKKTSLGIKDKNLTLQPVTISCLLRLTNLLFWCQLVSFLISSSSKEIPKMHSEPQSACPRAEEEGSEENLLANLLDNVENSVWHAFDYLALEGDATAPKTKLKVGWSCIEYY